jgi:glutathione S-transferase
MDFTLYIPGRGWGLPNISPACMKLETWFRMVDVPYKIGIVDPSLVPKGKIPFIRIGDEIMGDSTLIIERLSKELGKDLDAGLGPVERAVALAFRRMVKENLYWVMAYDRWCTDANFVVYGPLLKELFFAPLPVEQQEVYLAGLRQQMITLTHAQGMGRHTPDEVLGIGKADLQAISDYLGDRPFFMGNDPTLVDATLYAHLANIVHVRFTSALRDFSRALPNLVAYCERMQTRYFPDVVP